ncbi:YfhO family protein [Streptomyces sp. NPDC101227]|uniref:YfhO family protein n=1 Tax=Streptomyces sp. NPDC101227 TaxID=3366136 RepID=UPI0037FE2E2C
MRPIIRRLAAPGLAALLSMGAYCLALAVHGGYPFGGRSRAVNDLGNQFIPFHARLWDLLHGTTSGDLFFNWSSGYGVPFLADFLTYLMNPFSWLVGLFPRHLVEFPVFLVTLLSIGLGAALMTVFLGRLRPGPGLLRAPLAAGYGLCAWVLRDGSADPMWMWGLVSLPLTAIAADWCLHRRRWVAGTLLIALAWAGNFYTAAMASLATALVLLLRLTLASGTPVRDRLRSLGRAASMMVVGIALAAPALTVTLEASRTAQPAPAVSYPGPPRLLDQLAQLLPGGRGAEEAPDIFVGMLALLLVAAFPWVRAVPVRVRVGWYVLAAAVAGSFVWEPTILLWHGFALPNGSPFRAAFVLSGILVMIAWLALAHRPRARELAGGAALVGLLAWVCRDRPSVGGTWILVTGGGGVVLSALLMLAAAHRRAAPGAVRSVATAALAGAVLLGSASSAYSVMALRDNIAWFRPKATLSQRALAARDGLAARDDWPHSRSDPGPHEFANNDPLLIGGEGGSYYSSFVPAATARALRGLGAGWYINGRHTLSLEDPVGRALMGVSSYLAPRGGGRFTARPAAAGPLVTVRRDLGTAMGGARRTGAPGRPRTPGTETVFARQERALGAKVYEVPALTPAAGPAPGRTVGGWTLPDGKHPAPDTGPGDSDTPSDPGDPGDGQDGQDGHDRHDRHGSAGSADPADGDQPYGLGTTFTARCTPGGTAVWYAPWFYGQVSALGGWSWAIGRHDGTTANPVRTLGAVPADGTLSVRFAGPGRQHIPAHPIGCLPPRALSAALTARRAGGLVKWNTGGHGLVAELPPGSSGGALFALPAVPGWGCSVDGGPSRAAGSYAGLLAVPLGSGASRLSCAYAPPGLVPGLAASGAGALTLAAVALATPLFRRRNPSFAASSQIVAFHQICQNYPSGDGDRVVP